MADKKEKPKKEQQVLVCFRMFKDVLGTCFFLPGFFLIPYPQASGVGKSGKEEIQRLKVWEELCTKTRFCSLFVERKEDFQSKKGRLFCRTL